MTKNELFEKFRGYLIGGGMKSSSASYLSYIKELDAKIPSITNLLNLIVGSNRVAKQVGFANEIILEIEKTFAASYNPLKYKKGDYTSTIYKLIDLLQGQPCVNKNSRESVAISHVMKGEEQDPFAPPERGHDSSEEYSRLVKYNGNVADIEKVEDLCGRIESEYRELVYHFARDVFSDYFKQDFPPLIKVLLCKECPSKIYLNSDSYVTKKVNELIKLGKMVSSADVSKILRFNMRIAGEFISGDVPYIKIYFNQFDAESMEEYVSMFMNVLAHEFAHYLEYEYCKRYKVQHYQDARVSEAIADFFGSLFSCYRSGIISTPFDLDVVEKRYNGWREREGSGWPYSYALHFLHAPYKSKYSEYSDVELDVACEKLRQVFKATTDAAIAFNLLTR